MKALILFISIFFLLILGNEASGQTRESDKKMVSALLDSWHKAAAETDFEAYFGKMTGDAVFLGTDALENWNIREFKEYAKPFFDRGSAWSFTASDRNIYLSDSGEVAWFDELLNSKMGLLRGSGVAVKEGGKWKIKHYVLSFTIPNEIVPEISRLTKKD